MQGSRIVYKDIKNVSLYLLLCNDNPSAWTAAYARYLMCTDAWTCTYALFLIAGATACDTVIIERVGDLFRNVLNPVPPQGYLFDFTLRNEGSSSITINNINVIAAGQFALSVISPNLPFTVAPQSAQGLRLHLTDISGQVDDFHGLAIKASGPCGSVQNEIVLRII